MNITKTGQQPKPPRVLLYGVEGIGKTTFAANAPNCVFVRTEDGLDHIEADAFDLATTTDEVTAHLTHLRDEDHNYKVVALDSLDWLERILHCEVAADAGKKSIELIGYGKGFLEASDRFRELLAIMDDLREVKKMAIVLIAHAKIEKFRDPEGEAFDRYSPAIGRHISALSREWCDDVLFAHWDITRKTTSDDRRVAIAAERKIYASDRPSHVAKTRSGIPDEIELSWGSYVQARKNARQNNKTGVK